MPRSDWKRQVALFLTSQSLSLLGSSVVQFAIIWHLTMTTQSGEVMMLAVLVGILPMLLISPFGGVWADRLPKRYLIAGADALAAFSTLALFISALLGEFGLVVVLGAMALRAVGQAVQAPAVGAILPDIVPEDQLLRLNGYNGSIQSAIGIASPLLAGALLSVMPIHWVLLIDIVTAALAIVVMLWLVKATSGQSKQEEGGTSALRDLRDGAAYLVKHKFVARLYLYFALTMFLAGPVSILTPLQVTRTYSNEVWRLVSIEIAFCCGMVLGGVLIGLWGGFRRKAATAACGILVTAGGVVLLGVPQPFLLYNAWMFLIGIFLPFMNAPVMTLLQLTVDPKYLGRVMSASTMVYSSVMPLGMLLFGPLADQVSIELILIVTGVLMGAGSILMLFDPTIRRGEPAGGGVSGEPAGGDAPARPAV